MSLVHERKGRKTYLNQPVAMSFRRRPVCYQGDSLWQVNLPRNVAGLEGSQQVAYSQEWPFSLWRQY